MIKVIYQLKNKEFLKYYYLKPKPVVVIHIILICLVAVAMSISAWKGDVEDVFTCINVLIFFMLPYVIEWKLKIKLPTNLVIVVLLFIYASFILGEMDSFYIKFTFWDTMLHIINGFLCAAIGFGLVDKMNTKHQKNSFDPIYIAVFALCLSMTIGVAWEFYEFGMDSFFNRDMQKDTIVHTIKSVKLMRAGQDLKVYNGITKVAVNGRELGLGGYLDIGLYDTMFDLIDNFIGAFVCCISGYIYVKNGKIGKITRHLFPYAIDSLCNK